MENVETKIFRKIKRDKKNGLFFTDMFAKFGTAKAVSKALERLVQQGKIQRVATGIYVLSTGKEIFPDVEKIALAIAKRDKARIMPVGIYAEYMLGLTTQIPVNVVYYTDTSARKITVGSRTIKFKKASSRNLSFKGKISMMAVQALRNIGKGNVREDEVKHIKTILQNENPAHLRHDLLLAPVWIRELLTDKKGKEND